MILHASAVHYREYNEVSLLSQYYSETSVKLLQTIVLASRVVQSGSVGVTR